MKSRRLPRCKDVPMALPQISSTNNQPMCGDFVLCEVASCPSPVPGSYRTGKFRLEVSASPFPLFWKHCSPQHSLKIASAAVRLLRGWNFKVSDNRGRLSPFEPHQPSFRFQSLWQTRGGGSSQNTYRSLVSTLYQNNWQFQKGTRLPNFPRGNWDEVSPSPTTHSWATLEKNQNGQNITIDLANVVKPPHDGMTAKSLVTNGRTCSEPMSQEVIQHLAILASSWLVTSYQWIFYKNMSVFVHQVFLFSFQSLSFNPHNTFSQPAVLFNPIFSIPTTQQRCSIT